MRTSPDRLCESADGTRRCLFGFGHHSMASALQDDATAHVGSHPVQGATHVLAAAEPPAGRWCRGVAEDRPKDSVWAACHPGTPQLAHGHKAGPASRRAPREADDQGSSDPTAHSSRLSSASRRGAEPLGGFTGISPGSAGLGPDGADRRGGSFCRSSLKERGRSRVVVGVFLPLDRRSVGAPMRRRGQGSGGARPRSGRRALTPTPFGARCSGLSRSGVCRSPCFVGGASWTWLASVPVLAGGSRPVWLLGHPFAAWSAFGSWPGGMMGCASPVGRGQSAWLDLAVPSERDGGHDLHDLATDRGTVGAAHADSRHGWCSARTWPSRSA